MSTLFVTYSAGDDARFDRDYYVATHLPLCETTWGATGLLSAEAYFPARPGSGIVAVAVLRFADEAAIATSLAVPGSAAVMADVGNFTDIQPAIARGADL